MSLFSSRRKASRAPASAWCGRGVQGTDIVVTDGLAEGELIAGAGSFKLREGLLVQMTDAPSAGKPTPVN
jgi:hypothetical protein